MRRALIIGGVLFMGYGVIGAVLDTDINLVGVPIFLIAVLILHDGIFLPLVIGAGALVNRFIPRPWRGTVRTAGILSLAVCVVALPLVLGFGRSADNPSLLPRNYEAGLVGILALVWLVSLGHRRARIYGTPVWIGSISGLVTGLIVGSLQARQGMMAIDATGLSPGVGSAFAVTVLGSVIVGSFLRYRPHRLPALITTGVLAGLLWWAVEWLTVLPVLAGHRVTWSLSDAQAAFGFLIGSMIQSATTAVLVHLVSLSRASKVAAVRRADGAPAAGVERKRVVIVGGGFAGVSVAQRLERRLSRRDDVEVVLVSDSNYQLFTPMLAGVAAGTLQERHIGAPLRSTIPRTIYRHAALESMDAGRRQIKIRPEGTESVTLAYDHLVLAVGSVPDFRDLPGVRRHALPLKTLADAVRLRAHIIRHLELADVDSDAADRRRRLTVVVAGGGFAGAELIGEIRDMAHGLHNLRVLEAVAELVGPRLDPAEFRFVLVHAQDRILPEFQPRLAALALRRLRDKGIEVRLTARVAEVAEDRVILNDDTVIDAATVVWTAGNAPNPLVRRLGLDLEHGGLACEPTMRVRGQEHVWALGDCAAIPNPAGPEQFYPPTAQHAVREGAAVADNIVAVLDDRPPRPFRFRTIALLVTLGHQDGAAQIGGRVLSGRLAWALWRGIYLAKLPSLERRVQVALDWSLELFFPRDAVLTEPARDDRPYEPSARSS